MEMINGQETDAQDEAKARQGRQVLTSADIDTKRGPGRPPKVLSPLEATARLVQSLETADDHTLLEWRTLVLRWLDMPPEDLILGLRKMTRGQ